MRKIRIVFYTEMKLNREQWKELFCRSDIARLVQAGNVSIHFANHNPVGIRNKLEDMVGND